ncbi:MAG TPA: glycosyltransferase family 87 protein [Candidatus Dormibacteraeota bacterium]|nr:glycosyltransferase family 87 protein [Candidatus Dormibacteraeota bacterium]
MIAARVETKAHRKSALDDRRFRSLLLVLAAVPIAAVYAWRTLILPVFTGVVPLDFSANYMAAAAKIAAGRDPYDLCAIQGCAQQPGTFTPLPLAGAQYVTPPPVAWMLQPLVGADPHVQLAVVIGVLQLSVAIFLITTVRAVAVRDWQLGLLLVLVVLAFEPVAGNFDEGQINLVLLALAGVWLLAWVGGDRWWGGAALGVAVAIKLLQAPTGLLLLWGRRWGMLLAAALAGAALWLLAVPQYLAEYLLKVAPVLSAGTGLFENHSPGGTVARLFDPGTFLGAVRDTSTAARVVTTVIAVAALILTFSILRAPRKSRTGRALEAASIVAVGPMVASYSWGTHLVLLLLPMLVLIAWAVPRRDWMVLGLVAAGWALIGPAHNWFQMLLVSGYPNLLVLRLMAEFGVAGIIAVWIASLVAMRRDDSAHGPDPAHEHGAD